MRVVKGLRDTAVLEQHLKQTLQVRSPHCQPEPACYKCPSSCCSAAKGLRGPLSALKMLQVVSRICFVN